WVGKGQGVAGPQPYANRRAGNFVDPEPAPSFLRSLMFYDLAERGQVNRMSRNGGLREYDLSPQLQTGDFAVLVGKLQTDKGAAEDVIRKPSVPTTLWLGALPDGKAKRPDVHGSMRQET